MSTNRLWAFSRPAWTLTINSLGKFFLVGWSRKLSISSGCKVKYSLNSIVLRSFSPFPWVSSTSFTELATHSWIPPQLLFRIKYFLLTSFVLFFGIRLISTVCWEPRAKSNRASRVKCSEGKTSLKVCFAANDNEKRAVTTKRKKMRLSMILSRFYCVDQRDYLISWSV